MFDIYKLPDSHEQRVCNYALVMFDSLSSHPVFRDGINGEQQLQQKRELLKESAYYHDIGHSISEKKHDLHTMNLILTDSYFDNIPEPKRTMLALIAGGHRKKLHHPIENISPSNQQIVRQLAAILRLADAIDYTRQRDISVHGCRYDTKNFIINISNNLSIIARERVQKKSGLFQEVFLLRVKLENTI
ncbi:HD domain-containing protein [Desulfuribacillus alkaliarsenatis]|uniref:Ppx/GppA phosphatase C-terminal domain-containing protein n=1 Tax=Desulfuribacillus alkaliarsenatis TaxID=766136 RepID=A0A1E5G159_9FIRM|nr:HD domain-containing protein [Desulfuribacillus alkaliarsenatis]OEF96560.1 hypothetical protein BHF68_07900 [Desulfuribacillus alkaliarsenatis]